MGFAILHLPVVPALSTVFAVFEKMLACAMDLFGYNIMDFEDYLVSNWILPLGSLIFVLFCVTKYGWSWDKFVEEANQGKGIKIQK